MVGEGWCFLGLVGVEIGGRGDHFCWRGMGFSGFGRGGWRSVVGVVIFVVEGWVFLGLVRVGGDQWSRWSFLLVGVVVFVGEGWVFLVLIGVEIGGRFCTV